MLTTPTLCQRPICEARLAACQTHLPDWLARVAAARALPLDHLAQALSPSLADLDPPKSLKDIDKACQRITQAILAGEIIAFETDHDCDGQTAHAILMRALTDYYQVPRAQLQSYIGHRMTEGYGLSEALMQRILSATPRPHLIITADNGSSDEARIAQLAAAGVDVIVTDHHEIPESGCPESAYACINPTRPDCDYPDKMIAGCAVAWLLMVHLRQHLIDAGWAPAKDAPSLGGLLDYVAVGTIADCVSLSASVNNRIFVRAGLFKLNQSQRPCWQAIRAQQEKAQFDAEDLGFSIGPLLNSDGRLDSAMQSVSFLLTDTLEEAQQWYTYLVEQNTARKAIQKQMTEQAKIKALSVLKTNPKALSLALYLPDGHAGVHGISASRIKDLLGRPCAIFSPKAGQPGVITASVRGIEGVHIRQALAKMQAIEPKMIAFGGHEGAAGLTLKETDFPWFCEAFEAAVSEQISSQAVGPKLWLDGQLSSAQLNEASVECLEAALAPFGRGFEAPIFEVRAQLTRLDPVGDGTHARVTLTVDGQLITGIWFQARESNQSDWPVSVNSTVRVALALKNNHFKGRVSFNPIVQHMSTDLS